MNTHIFTLAVLLLLGLKRTNAQTFYYERGGFRQRSIIELSTRGKKSGYEIPTTYWGLWGDVRCNPSWDIAFGYIGKKTYITYSLPREGFGASNFFLNHYFVGAGYNIRFLQNKIQIQPQVFCDFNHARLVRPFPTNYAQLNYTWLRIRDEHRPGLRFFPTAKIKLTYRPLKRLFFYAHVTHVFGYGAIQRWDAEQYSPNQFLASRTVQKINGTGLFIGYGGGIYFGKSRRRGDPGW